MSKYEKAVISRILMNDEWPVLEERGITSWHFQDKLCKSVIAFMADFKKKYGAIPSVELIEESFSELKVTSAKDPVDFYLDKVIENFARNETSKMLLNSAKELAGKPTETIEKLHSELAALSLDVAPTKDDGLQDSVGGRKERYLRIKNVGGMDGIPTPWKVLDEATMGLHAGDFIAIVSRPGTGKTFLLTLFSDFIVSNGLKVLFVTNEMSNTQIIQRFDAIHFKLPFKELRAGLLPDYLEERYFEGLSEMEGQENKMVVTQNIHGVSSIGTKIDQYKPDVVIVDGMYLLADDEKAQNKWENITNISRNIKKLARKKKVPIIATTQFNRATEDIAINKVTLASLGFSDSIGQDADVVLGMFRTKDMEMNNEMKIRMLKVREGEPKDFTLTWDLHRMDFDVIETADDDALLPEEDAETLDY